MNVARVLLMGIMLAALPLAAHGEIIPISDVNADDPPDDIDGIPVLLGSVVTVKGVVTVGTGVLAETNDLYIQDATGGVNVIQESGASPVVAQGDSVLVTGKVALWYGNRTYIQVDTVIVPGSRIEILSSGNALPDPVVVTPRELAAAGEVHEGIYAVVRRVGLPDPTEWPSSPCTEDAATCIADADTTCRIWFDADSDLCASPAPLDTFDVWGIVIPRPRTVSSWKGHGMLPPARSYVRSRGSGSGSVEVAPERVFADQVVELTFTMFGEADTLNRVSIGIPDGWEFSGDAGDVILSGDAFAEAYVDAGNTTPEVVMVAAGELAYGVSGTVTIGDLETPYAAGAFAFEVATGVGDHDPVPVQASPEVEVGFLADPGTVVINEVYAHSNEEVDTKDRAEFVELYNPGRISVDISGWILTDLDESGVCGGSNLWEFPTDPPTVMAPGGYLVVTKDAWMRPQTRGFLPVFADSVDLETLQIFELVDENYSDSDWMGDATWPDVPNMARVSPDDDNMATSQEIRLLGGYDGNGPLVVGTPACDAVYLYSDRTLTGLVDAMEYRDPVFLAQDFCPDEFGLGGADDAYVPGAPPNHYSLGRDALSTDTDVTRDDFVLCSWPTPGAVNVPSDHKAPKIENIQAVGSEFMLVEFNEPVDPDEATEPSHYEIDNELATHGAWLSRDGRSVLLWTGSQVPDTPYVVGTTGVTDLSGNTMEPDSRSVLGYFDVITPISSIQEYDENGYSPLWGQEATVIGLTTVPPGIFQPDRTSMYVQDLGGWGLNIYSSDLMTYPALEGDLVKASGLVVEYRSIDSDDPWSTPAGSTTEISNSVISVVARGFDIIEPTVLPTGDVGDESLEGTLVRSSGVVVSVEGFSFYIDDGTGACQVYQNFSDLDFAEYAVGDSVRVTGVVLQYDYTEPYFGGYELAPRYDTDLVTLSAHYSDNASVTTSTRVLNIAADEVIEISFNATRASHIAVRIFDLKGRAITTLYDGPCLGPLRSAWDGRDENGRKVPPGVYVCHVQARERSGSKVTDAAVPIVVGTKLD